MPKQKPAALDESPVQPAENEKQPELPSETVSSPDFAAAPDALLPLEEDQSNAEPARPMIELRYSYQGRPSRGRLIQAGRYVADDPALFGLANYLLKTGQAEVVEES